jgi:hypothetical protein
VLRCLVQELGADVNQTALHGETPLVVAARLGSLTVVRCLIDLGAEVNQATSDGDTPLIVAAAQGCLAVVRCLIELGANIGAGDDQGYTALLESACNGQFATTQYLLEEAGADIQDVANDGETVWNLLRGHLQRSEPAALTGLLRVMVLRGAPPPALVALLSPEPARVVQEGARLRARLPAYLVRRRALLDAHCPVLQPPLRNLVHGYMELTTTEELWATGLGQAS